MKTRQGFVSNSSSSSFVISLDGMSASQLNKIENHIHFSRKIPAPEDCSWYNREDNAWEITVDDDMVRGYTFMNNFNMRHFLNCIGVSDEAIAWDGDSLERRRIDAEAEINPQL